MENSPQQQNVENNQQIHQPLPPIPDIYVQQLNINDNYQLPGHQCHYHQQELNGSSNHSNQVNSNNSNRSANNSSVSSTQTHHLSSNPSSSNDSQNSNQSSNLYNNTQSLYKQVFRRNQANSLSTPTTYSSNYCNSRNQSFKNYCIQSPTLPKNDPFCASCSFNLVNNSSNANNLTNFTSIISKNLSKDVNWQSSLNSVRERNAVLFNNEYMSDITFLVGSDANYSIIKNDKNESDNEEKNKVQKTSIKNDYICRVPGHKFILGSASTVFYAMLYGGLAEKSSEIELPDVEPQGFLALLK